MNERQAHLLSALRFSSFHLDFLSVHLHFSQLILNMKDSQVIVMSCRAVAVIYTYLQTNYNVIDTVN